MAKSVDLTDCLSIEQSGRAGRITAKLGSDVLLFDWEFGAAPVVAIVYVPSPSEWSGREPWPKLNRDDFSQRSVRRSVESNAPAVSTAPTITSWNCENPRCPKAVIDDWRKRVQWIGLAHL
jgi:hypothetical protein